MESPLTHRVARVFKWTGIIGAGLLVVLLITLAVLDANADALRGPVARIGELRVSWSIQRDPGEAEGGFERR